MGERNGKKTKGADLSKRLWSYMKVSVSQYCFSLQGGTKQKASLHRFKGESKRNQWQMETCWMQGTDKVFFLELHLNKVVFKLVNPGTPWGNAAAFLANLCKHPRLSSGGLIMRRNRDISHSAHRPFLIPLLCMFRNMCTSTYAVN